MFYLCRFSCRPCLFLPCDDVQHGLENRSLKKVSRRKTKVKSRTDCYNLNFRIRFGSNICPPRLLRNFTAMAIIAFRDERLGENTVANVGKNTRRALPPYRRIVIFFCTVFSIPGADTALRASALIGVCPGRGPPPCLRAGGLIQSNA